MQGMPSDDNTGGSSSQGTPPTTVGMGGASTSAAPSSPPPVAQGGAAGAFPGLGGAPLACWPYHSAGSYPLALQPTMKQTACQYRYQTTSQGASGTEGCFCLFHAPAV